uniref:Uncharacterized protein n=1 Tax=Medicago truncatula TaxID=3880 RepID=Q2HVM8_MEDTR|nr:hypothetical protein MtrDRAFT_AC148816g12v2 [Medicago truncatula]
MFWIVLSRFRKDLRPKKSKHYGTPATHASGSPDQIRQCSTNHTEMHTTPLTVLYASVSQNLCYKRNTVPGKRYTTSLVATSLIGLGMSRTLCFL